MNADLDNNNFLAYLVINSSKTKRRGNKIIKIANIYFDAIEETLFKINI